MFFHSADGEKFVGLRALIGGRYQVVYDARTGTRLSFDILSHDVTSDDVARALEEGVRSPDVLTGVFRALKCRGIDFEYPELP